MKGAARDATTKRRKLHQRLREMKRVLIAFSGGRDSVLLLHEAAVVLGPNNVRAVTAESPIRPKGELVVAKIAARSCGVRHEAVQTDELSLAAFRSNGPERCRACKIHLFNTLRNIAESDGIEHLLDGMNATEVSERDQLLLAPEYLRVESPLADAGLTLSDVLMLTEGQSLASPNGKVHCLASRVSMGIPITTELLGQIERAETYLVERGFSEAVIRVHSDGLARIKVPATELDDLLRSVGDGKVARAVCDLGFANVAVDLDGI